MSRLKIKRTLADSRTIRTSMREPEDIGQELKTLIDGRDNDEIINFLEIQSSFQVQEQFKVFSLARLRFSPDCMVSYSYKSFPFPVGGASVISSKWPGDPQLYTNLGRKDWLDSGTRRTQMYRQEQSHSCGLPTGLQKMYGPSLSAWI